MGEFMENVAIASTAANSGAQDAVRTSLASAIEQNAALKAAFDWASEVLNDRTDQFVDRYLTAHPPGFLPWCEISGHLRALGYHLDQCQARQAEIANLESACISAVLDCLNAERLFDIDEQLGLNEVGFQAQAETPERKAELLKMVSEKFAVRRDIFTYRKSFFSAPQGPLNYNQRVRFLRNLQADSVQRVYIRAKTLRYSLKCNGMADLPEPPPWSTGDDDSLDDLVLWARQAMQAVEDYSALERQVTIYISTEKHWKYFSINGTPLQPTQITDMLRTGGYDEVMLSVTPQLIQDLLNWTLDRPLRLLSASVGLLFGGQVGSVLGAPDDQAARDKEASIAAAAREWQASKRGGMRIGVPKQVADYGPAQSPSWTYPDIWLDNTVGIVSSFDDPRLTSLPAYRVANINPMGQWKIDISDRLCDPRYFDGLGSKFFDDRYDWTRPLGLVVGLRLGYREVAH
jgi:hypothetical protein